MTNLKKAEHAAPSAADSLAILHFHRALADGRHWFIALLEAIGLWTTTRENVGERSYRYVICDEAFDWLLLAERLCETTGLLLPPAVQREATVLLFYGVPPLPITQEEFQRLIGPGKYLQYLNYFYGITIEEILVLTVEEEVRKDRHASIVPQMGDQDNEIYRRIYGATEAALLKKFRQEMDYVQTNMLGLTERKEFIYWLFRYRLVHSDPSRVASDTKKALDFYREQSRRTGRKVMIP